MNRDLLVGRTSQERSFFYGETGSSEGSRVVGLMVSMETTNENIVERVEGP